jgi:hypothetical protein
MTWNGKFTSGTRNKTVIYDLVRIVEGYIGPIGYEVEKSGRRQAKGLVFLCVDIPDMTIPIFFK